MLLCLIPTLLASLAHGDRLDDLENTMIGLQDQVGLLKNELAYANRRIDTFNTTHPFVAFTMSVNQERFYYYDDIVIFDKEITNTGFYNTNGNVFICPLSGYYMFSITIYKGSSSEYNFGVKLSIDGQQVSSVFQSFDGQANLYMHSTSTVVAHCATGKFVYIRAVSSGKLIAIGNRSTFSGYLIRLDDEQ